MRYLLSLSFIILCLHLSIGQIDKKHNICYHGYNELETELKQYKDSAITDLKIWLPHCDVSDETLKRSCSIDSIPPVIGSYDSLKTLRLYNVSGLASYAFIKNINNLRNLSIGGTYNIDYKTIGNLNQLENLTFIETTISDEDLNHFIQMKNLKSLTLIANFNITEYNVSLIQQKMPHCKIILE
ncbi:hypothetical protein K6119_11335 [Paracrocinitomix mangrovi]|uniref:hypothetical protein n=1 Tax=Paracrocinitomix mangrovi TaxID=2862509 RepID=UPI001C8E781C|nr:hypothetical protein [Paracrocinitomix mangrovi]UKN00327.1 hypothetical protein K6119_11335 [Paracrocinitomix mangrovi]